VVVARRSQTTSILPHYLAPCDGRLGACGRRHLYTVSLVIRQNSNQSLRSLTRTYPPIRALPAHQCVIYSRFSEQTQQGYPKLTMYESYVPISIFSCVMMQYDWKLQGSQSRPTDGIQEWNSSGVIPYNLRMSSQEKVSALSYHPTQSATVSGSHWRRGVVPQAT
jgi:hypothetical protein